MKKTIIYTGSIILIFLCIYCSFINTSYSINKGTIYTTSNKETYQKEEEIEITINIENKKTTAYNFSLYFDELKLEYISNLENTNVINNRIIFVWHDEKGGKGAKQGELVKIKFKAKEEGIANFVIQGEFYNEEGQLIETNFKEKQIQIGTEETYLQKQEKEEQNINTQSNNASLQVLRTDKEGITPNFQKDIFDYYLTVKNDVNNLEILAISENINSKIEITGNLNLKPGINTVKIEVTSEDGTTKNIYTINVTKTANIELANTNLEILAIQNVLLNPPFDLNTTHYKAQVSNDTTNLNIFAVPENENAVVQIVGNNELKIGNNLIKIIVTAPNGISKKVYQVEVNRRNIDEEIKYQEEQSKQKEMLEKAYEVEEINSKTNEEKENHLNNKRNKSSTVLWIIGTLIIITILIIFFSKYYKISK